MRIATHLVIYAVAIAIMTALLGWWTVPIVSAALTCVLRRRGSVLIATTAGAVAWGILLLLTRRAGPVSAVDQMLSGTLRMPDGFGIALTLMFAAVLSGAAAAVCSAERKD